MLELVLLASPPLAKPLDDDGVPAVLRVVVLPPPPPLLPPGGGRDPPLGGAVEGGVAEGWALDVDVLEEPKPDTLLLLLTWF